MIPWYMLYHFCNGHEKNIWDCDITYKSIFSRRFFLKDARAYSRSWRQGCDFSEDKKRQNKQRQGKHAENDLNKKQKTIITGFDLIFQKWFVSVPNKINSKTDLECRSPWFRDKNFFALDRLNWP